MKSIRGGSVLYTIQIGSFVLNGQILLLIAFGWFGWAAVRGYVVKKLLAEDDFGSIAFQGFVIWLLLWKGSLLLLDPVQTIQYPTSLLYFDGGVSGRWIASIITGIYVAYRTWKQNASWKLTIEAATVFLMGGAAAYHAGLIWFESDNWPFHAGYAVLASVTLLSFYIVKPPIPLIHTLQSWQWFSIGLTLLWFLHPERAFLIRSFSTQQMISFTAGMTLSVYLWLYHGQQTNDKRSRR